MDEEAVNFYIKTIADSIKLYDKFGAKIAKWQFMIVSHPKVPFASEPHTPNITFTFDLINEANAKRILNGISQLLYDRPYEFKGNDGGKYLICSYN